ncbi:MAG: cation transporter [Deltaproteobacteria bacterium]|nr:cation transporter [Deltaproteobacteria bacterium]
MTHGHHGHAHHGHHGLDGHTHGHHGEPRGAGPQAGEARRRNRRRLGIILVLTVGYMVAEVIGGWLTNSLALLADAGHMLSDAGALALSFFAIWIADRRAPPQRTFGYHRSEILAALANGALLIVIATVIVVEAVQRFGSPPEVDGPAMMMVAAGGLVVNAIGLVILSRGRNESLNVRGAWLHVLTDALGSLGAMTSAALIWFFDWRLADPIASILIAILVTYSAWPLLKQTLSVLMENAPSHIDVEAVRRAMGGVAGVSEVHDLHVWTITQGLDCLSGHVVTHRGADHQLLLRDLRLLLRSEFAIEHVTIQMEHAGLEEYAVCDQSTEVVPGSSS